MRLAVFDTNVILVFISSGPVLSRISSVDCSRSVMDLPLLGPKVFHGFEVPIVLS
jgi:hypothetical protein